MHLVRETLQGISAKDEDEGRIGLGRHATCIRLGRDLWSSADLSAAEQRCAKEFIFDGNGYPQTKEALDAAASAMKLDQERPAPFTGKTLPRTHLTMFEYTSQCNRWLANLAREDDPPTAEQMEVLEKIKSRVLMEFE